MGRDWRGRQAPVKEPWRPGHDCLFAKKENLEEK